MDTDKTNLLLLHGALGAVTQFTPLLPLLAGRFRLHPIEFAGHGATPLGDGEFSIRRFADDLLAYIEAHNLAPANIFGYSMGGYVACTLALSNPQAIAAVFTLGTKFYWDPETASRETGRLDPQKIKAKVPHFAQVLAERHSSEGWEQVLQQTSAVLFRLGEVGGLRPAQAAKIESRVRIAAGDRDSTVTLAECSEMALVLPHGQLEVLPSTPHELERVSPARLAYSIDEFFATERN